MSNDKEMLRGKLTTADIMSKLKQNIMICVCVALLVICSVASDKFLTYSNIMSILRQYTVVGILGIGACIAIISGGIDASLAHTMCFGVMLMGLLQDLPMGAIILIVLLATFCVGTISGIAIAYFKIVPFIATTAMATIMEGAALLVNDGKPLYWQGNHSYFPSMFGSGATYGFSHLVMGFLILVIIWQFVLSRTRLGFAWRAIGGNSQAAYWSGTDVPKYTVLAYSCSAMMAGVAAIFMFARVGTSEPTAGAKWTTDALSAAVLGGTVIGGGGKGSIAGVILGAFMLGMINNIFNLINVSTYVQYVAKGIILLIAVIIGSDTIKIKAKKQTK